MVEEYQKLEGEWVTAHHENLEEMLVKLGAPFMIRKVAPRAKPSQKLSFEGKVMKILVETGFKTKESVVPIDGSEFNDEMFGQTYVGTAEVCDDGSIKTKGKLGDVGLAMERKLNGDGQMVLITVVDGVTCTRVFNRKP